MTRIVVLTGAGISAESGLGTFRDNDGLWARYRIEDLATPEAFARNPELVHEFYNMRRAKAARAKPNAAHHALARLAHAHELTLITQNVDGLHEAAHSDPIHMHGALAGALCGQCGCRWKAPMHMSPLDACPSCGVLAARPDIVWFGEIPYQMERCYDALERADIFAAIGTSGQVYPAAGFLEIASATGAETHEFNLEPMGPADFHHLGPASQTVPAWVKGLAETQDGPATSKAR